MLESFQNNDNLINYCDKGLRRLVDLNECRGWGGRERRREEKRGEERRRGEGRGGEGRGGEGRGGDDPILWFCSTVAFVLVMFLCEDNCEKNVVKPVLCHPYQYSYFYFICLCVYLYIIFASRASSIFVSRCDVASISFSVLVSIKMWLLFKSGFYSIYTRGLY